MIRHNNVSATCMYTRFLLNMYVCIINVALEVVSRVVSVECSRCVSVMDRSGSTLVTNVILVIFVVPACQKQNIRINSQNRVETLMSVNHDLH